ncbi:hypothetical protein QBC36DRAFT_321395 [Triangularia setosa]|uniref:Uncharacterized protein n=1 Tax=Triangularia setosa TaxID=2587417 RepID=A0AAN6WF23_9PEZI|nr:hypothetical protein QBC36DRAFT_321395 [Podospora setosa]
MSGDEDTSEWEPIPSLSSLSPFSSPALSFLLLNNDHLAHDSGPSFHGKHDGPGDAPSHTPATPRPKRAKTPLDLTPSPPSTTRSMHDLHQTPTQPSPLQLSRLGLGLHHLGIGPPMPLSPLHHKDQSWMSSSHHEEVIKEETSITHDADDEDEDDDRNEREVMNRQSLIYDQTAGDEDQEDQQDMRDEQDVMKRLSLIFGHKADGEDENERDEQKIMSRQSLVYGKGADDEDEDDTSEQEVVNRQNPVYGQETDDEGEDGTDGQVMNRQNLAYDQGQNGDDTDGQVMNRQSLSYGQETGSLQLQSLIYDHGQGTDGLRHYLTYDHDQPTDEITQSSKAILLNRLEDLLHRLASSSPKTDLDTIDVLHAKVDEMERVLEATSPARPGIARRRMPEILQPSQTFTQGSANQSFTQGTDNQSITQDIDNQSVTQESVNQSFTQPGISLNHSMSESMPDTLSPSASLERLRRSIVLPPALATTPPPWLLPSASSPIKSFEIFSATMSSPTQPELDAAAEATNEALEAAKEAARAHSEMTERIAAEADQLRKDLATVISKLQARREETDVCSPQVLFFAPYSFYALPSSK